MKRIFSALLVTAALFAVPASWAQPSSNTARRIQGGTKPATCNAGPPADVWIDTSASPHALNVCTATDTWTAINATPGITNGAGNNVIPKSNGTNLVASSATDDGTTVTQTATPGSDVSQFTLTDTAGTSLNFVLNQSGSHFHALKSGSSVFSLFQSSTNGWRMTSSDISAQFGGVSALIITSTEVQPGTDAAVSLGDATHRYTGLSLSGPLTSTATANGITFATFKRFTDTSPTGNFENFQNAAAGSLWTVDITGSLTAGSIPNARLVTAASGTGSCTNQAVTALNAAAAPTCTTLTSAYVNNTIALTGTDVNTSNQVTATHLAAALPVNQGGTGTVSTLTGLVRGGSPMTAAELSGDCTTSGSNAVTCVRLNGANFAVNTSGLPTVVDGITTAGQGVAIVQCITSAKVETGADAAVLSCTPAAAVGGYEVCVAIDVSAANTATLGWTLTWTNSKGNANAPTNMHLYQMGVAAPALTFSAAANNSYYACVPIAVNNAGTAIVVKTTFSGTSIAYNVTATIKRII